MRRRSPQSPTGDVRGVPDLAQAAESKPPLVDAMAPTRLPGTPQIIYRSQTSGAGPAVSVVSCDWSAGKPGRRAACRLQERPGDSRNRRSGGSLSTVGVRVHAIARCFGDEQAVAGVDLEIRAGEIVALVGLNGAGKSNVDAAVVGHAPTG